LGDCPPTHYIRVDVLEDVVLREIRRLTRFATRYEDEFARAVMGRSRKAAEDERRDRQRELNKLTARDREIDSLFNRMYEDNVSGRIDDERFARMSKSYAEEQAGIAAKTKTLQAELDRKEDNAVTSEMFMSVVRKYTRARKLTPMMVREFIDRIEVRQAEKIGGARVQKLTIHYNCVGEIEIPDLPDLSKTDVTINTRKGVNVTYATDGATVAAV
jgi:hypothetical protein